MLVAATPPIVTVVFGVKLSPDTVTDVPPNTGPVFGEIVLIAGNETS